MNRKRSSRLGIATAVFVAFGLAGVFDDGGGADANAVTGCYRRAATDRCGSSAQRNASAI